MPAPGRRLGDLIPAYMRYTAKSEPPDSYHLWSFLAMVASVARRNVWIDMGFGKIYCNVYVVLIGPAGKCRKTTAIKLAKGVVTGIPDVNFSADSTTRQSLSQTLKELETTVTIPTEDGKEYYTHCSMTILSKELSVFLGEKNLDLLAFLTDVYDCPSTWVYRTKNQGEDVLQNVWVSLLGASTPDWLVGALGDSAIGGGFTSRVIFVVEQDVRHKVFRYELTEEERALGEDIRADLGHVALARGPFSMTEGAAELCAAWYEQVDNNPLLKDRRFTGYITRKHMHLLKVAMLISLCESNALVIKEDHIARALDYLDAIEPSMVQAFGYAGRSELAPAIGLIKEYIKMSGSISRPHLLKATALDVAPQNFDIVITTLINTGDISVDSRGGIIYYAWKEDQQ